MIELAVLTVLVAIVVFAVVYYKTRDKDEDVLEYPSHPYYPYDHRPLYQEPETVYDPINGTIRPRRYSQGGLATVADYDEDDETPPLVYIPATHGQDADPIVNRHVDYDSPNINISGPSTTGDFPSPQTVSDNLSDTLERASESFSQGFKPGWSGGGDGDIGQSSGGSAGGSSGFDSGSSSSSYDSGSSSSSYDSSSSTSSSSD